MNKRPQLSRMLARLHETGQELHHISGHIALAEQDLGSVQLLSTTFADLLMFLGDANMPVTMPAKQLGALVVQLAARIENSADALVDVLGQFDAPDGQERRAARVLAVAALAGELATEFGITGWPVGAPTSAGVQAFRHWQAQRGAPGHSAEHVGVLQAVSDFIDRCGDARFSDISELAATQPPVRDRAGYWKAEAGRRLYLFTGAGMKEAIKGYDLNRALAALNAAGAIARKSGGKNSVLLTTPDGRRPRLYVIDPAKLDIGT